MKNSTLLANGQMIRNGATLYLQRGMNIKHEG